MSRFNILKFRSSYLTFLVLLLLMLGPAQSSWCFQNGDITIVPETLITDCHSVPSVCLPSTTMLRDYGKQAAAANCIECLDLSFEEISSTFIQDRNPDFIFTPGIAYIQLQAVEGFKLANSPVSVSYLKRLLRTSLNLHRSIQSTVLII